ncbi:MAG TPA: serine/threonine-protein kinase [Gemmatimonadaceae bacterium]|nr:serine/threonine-protein kinase [Gemmatimonadaceae bacterium]
MAAELLEELREALREHYAVESEVGRGGMATVFVAEDLKHGRRVAIKVLSPELSSSLDSDRFKREIQIAARLSHPHILPVFDSGEANGLLYYVMPFVEGESLRGRIKRESQLPIDDAIGISCEVADALSYAHSFGVIHRDIKPENILLHGGHAVVADFGIARVIQDAGGQKLTQTGMSVGTAAYMSPEQFSGENIDGRSDLYSLACVLYEMLVGEVPFTGPNAIAIMARHTMELPPSIQIVRGTVPDELEGAIMHALEKVPADRFATVAQFKEALLGQGATSTYARRTRAYTKQHQAATQAHIVKRRRRTLAYGAVALLFVAAGSLAARYYFLKPPKPRADINLHRIAVRYLENETSDSGLAHVADGLTESLIGQLSRVDGLNVVSSSGMRPYRSTEIPDDSVGRALKAGMLVHGGIEERSNQLRISLNLVDGQSGASIQRASLSVAKGDYLRARDSLVRTVADLLRKRLGEEIRLREQQNSTSSVEAWTYLQRAQKATKDAEDQTASGHVDVAQQRLNDADSLATLAAQADPKWPDPLVARAQVAYRRARLAKEQTATTELIQQGVARADQALAIDSLDADALEMRGTLNFFKITRGYVPNQNEASQIINSAEKDLRAATGVEPRQATAWNTLSVLQYHSKQDVPEAYLDAQKAYEADAYLRAAPDIVFRLYVTSYDLGSFDPAKRWCMEGLSRFPKDPQFSLCQMGLLLAKPNTPDVAEAWRLSNEMTRLTPPQDTALSRRMAQMYVASVIARAGLRDSSHNVIERARAGPEIDKRGELMGLEALARTFLGERAEAISTLERYLTTHPEHRAGFAKATSWWWRDLQKEPRIKELVGIGR